MQDQQRPARSGSNESEIDLGVFFEFLIRIFRKMANGIGRFFVSLFDFIILLLLFIKRRIIWLVVGAALGIVWAYLYAGNSGNGSYSEMTVRANFHSAAQLYNDIDYLNALIRENKTDALASTFAISKAEASRLQGFSIEPVNDELEAATLYRERFLEYAPAQRIDTSFKRIVPFKEFKEQLKPFDFPLHRIRLNASAAVPYTSIGEGLARLVSLNKDLVAAQSNTIDMYRQEEAILLRSLNSLDSLRKYIANNPSNFAVPNSILLLDKNFPSPQATLFENEMMLKDELMEVKKKLIEQQNLVQVYAGFNPVGNHTQRAKRDLIWYAIYGMGAALILLILFELIRYLNKIDQQRKPSSTGR